MTIIEASDHPHRYRDYAEWFRRATRAQATSGPDGEVATFWLRAKAGVGDPTGTPADYAVAIAVPKLLSEYRAAAASGLKRLPNGSTPCKNDMRGWLDRIAEVVNAALTYSSNSDALGQIHMRIAAITSVLSYGWCDELPPE